MRPLSAVATVVIIACGTGCKKSQPPPVPQSAFCKPSDQQCREQFGFAVGPSGNVRYTSDAKGLPYEEIFNIVAKRSIKDEFETTKAQTERIAATPDVIEKQFGKTFVLKIDLPELGYDADRSLLSFRENRPDVHKLAHVQVRARYEDYSVVSQACPELLSHKMDAKTAKSILAGLGNDALDAFYVGEYDNDFSRKVVGFETRAPGFIEERFALENPVYGWGSYSSRWIAVNLERLDIAERATGEVIFSSSCGE